MKQQRNNNETASFQLPPRIYWKLSAVGRDAFQFNDENEISEYHEFLSTKLMSQLNPLVLINFGWLSVGFMYSSQLFNFGFFPYKPSVLVAG